MTNSPLIINIVENLKMHLSRKARDFLSDHKNQSQNGSFVDGEFTHTFCNFGVIYGSDVSALAGLTDFASKMNELFDKYTVLAYLMPPFRFDLAGDKKMFMFYVFLREFLSNKDAMKQDNIFVDDIMTIEGMVK